MADWRANDSYVDMAKYLEALLIANANTLGLGNLSDGTPAVFFGDQQNIPVTPVACVDPGGKTRTLEGAPRRTETTMTNYIIVYHYELKSLQDVREDAERLAEAVETLVHSDPFMDDSVMHSMVTSVEAGYLQRRNSLYRASRLTVEARAMAQLPSQFS